MARLYGQAPLRIGAVEREDVDFASGKDRCAAWLFRPERAEAPMPCVVMASGFSCVRDQGLEAFGERFAAAGFAVLAFDYRYFAGSGGEPRQLVLAGRQREDWRAAISYVRSLDLVDERRLAIWGFSAGGGHVQALALSETTIAAAICVAPLVDGTRTLRYIGGLPLLARLGLAGARDGLRALRGAEPYRLAHPVRRIPIPILYCIAKDDDVTPPTLGKQAAERAPFGELRTYPGGHFAAFLGQTVESMASDQLDFLARHLTAG
jgi:uncharacterized protein